VNYSFFETVFINPEFNADISITVITPFKQKDLLAGVWQTTECTPEKVFIQPDFGWLRKGELCFLAATLFTRDIQHSSGSVKHSVNLQPASPSGF